MCGPLKRFYVEFGKLHEVYRLQETWLCRVMDARGVV